MKKRSKPKTRIATLDHLSRPITILTKIANARALDRRLTVSSRDGNLVLSASIEKETLRLGEEGPMKGKVWAEYRTDAEGAITQELGIEPRLFKVATGPAKGIAIEVRNERIGEGKEARIKTMADITDLDGVTTECPVLGSDCVEKARRFDRRLWGRATVGELSGAFSWAYRAISTDDGRPHLAALALTGPRVVATDGHRLHVAPIPMNVEIESLIPMIAARALLEIFKASSNDDQVTISGDEEGLTIDVGKRWSVSVCFPTHKGYSSGEEEPVRFPPFHKVIPSPWERAAVVRADSAKLLKATKKAQTVLKGAFTKCVQFVPFDEALRVSAENVNDDLRVSMKVPILETRNRLGYIFAANVDYVVDALLEKGEVEIFFGPEANVPEEYQTQAGTWRIKEIGSKPAGHTTDATVFCVGEDMFAVVMPMRL